MKKILAIILSVTMIFALAVTASATHTIGEPNGVDSITEQSGNGGTGDVKLTVGTVSDKYAVDVVFPTMTIALGDLTWNVNTHKWDYSYPEGLPTHDGKDAKVYPIEITNHSSKGIDITGTKNNADVVAKSDLSLTVTSAANAVGVKHGANATTATINVTLTPTTSWDDSINSFLNGTNSQDLDSKTFTFSTITVTVSQSA